MRKNIAKFLIVTMVVTGVMTGCGKKTDNKSKETTTEVITSENVTTEATTTEAATTEEATTAGSFKYQHDPKLNASAMDDIIENPDAVYGFSPNPESKRLGSFAEYDWTDAEAVAGYKAERMKYHESIEGMYTMLRKLSAEGKTIEEMAKAISNERNRIRLDSYKDDPEGLAEVKKSNLDTYGHEEGPLPEELYEKYGSWETVLQKAFGTNSGMDACVGLYDDYYYLYVELGQVEE